MSILVPIGCISKMELLTVSKMQKKNKKKEARSEDSYCIARTTVSEIPSQRPDVWTGTRKYLVRHRDLRLHVFRCLRHKRMPQAGCMLQIAA